MVLYALGFQPSFQILDLTLLKQHGNTRILHFFLFIDLILGRLHHISGLIFRTGLHFTFLSLFVTRVIVNSVIQAAGVLVAWQRN